MCGECSSAAISSATDAGSSPRVRGMPVGAPALLARRGIIPACAGNAHPGGASTRKAGDHPRVCGECYGHLFRADRDRGSSPRVRGMPAEAPAVSVPAGIIPACAGNASGRLCRSGRPADHPRVCGECAHGCPVHFRHAGSSPRVRGMLPLVGVVADLQRIIPACAGNATVPCVEHPTGGDHPRVCGECDASLLHNRRDQGSSPRVRGMRPSTTAAAAWSRIIPACAGNAGTHDRRPCDHGDHPRVCGECSRAAVYCGNRAGSSPRVRGMRILLRRRREGGRIIPACAGNAPVARHR